MPATATAVVPALDLARLLKGIPRGAWVAISSKTQTVLAYGSDMRNVLQQANQKGDPHPIITRVPEGSAVMLL